MQVHVQVHAERKGAVLDVHVEVIEAVGFQHTHVPVVVDRSVVLHHLGTAPDVHPETVVDAVILEEDVVPIIGGIRPRRETLVLPAADVECRITGCGKRVAGEDSLIVLLHVGHGVHDVQPFRRHGSHRLVTDGGVDATFLPFLGSHEDDAVRPAGTIHSSCRSIFHDGESLDILRHDTRQIQLGGLDTINQDQRVDVRPGLERGDTPDVELGIHLLLGQGTGKTTRLPPHDTGDLTGEAGGQVTARRLQVHRTHRGNRRHDALLLLLAESHDHRFVQLLHVLLHRDAQRVACHLLGKVQRLFLEADKRELQRSARHTQIHGEPSLGIRRRPDGQPGDFHRHPRHGLLLLVENVPFHPHGFRFLVVDLLPNHHNVPVKSKCQSQPGQQLFQHLPEFPVFGFHADHPFRLHQSVIVEEITLRLLPQFFQHRG